MKRPKAWLALSGMGLGLAGCGRVNTPSAPARATPSATQEPAADAPRDDGPLGATSGPPFVVGTVEQASTAPGAALLLDVRSARHAGFDRVVFEFAAARPGYHVEYIDRPVRRCGSGEPTPIAGDGWLEVRFYVAEAHTPSGAPTIARREQHPALALVKELEQTCDFEGYVTWTLGVARPNKYRAFTLEKPPRVVVDIEHTAK